MKSLVLIEEAYDLHKLYSPNRQGSTRFVLDRANALLSEVNKTYIEEKDEALLKIKKLLKKLIFKISHLKT